MEIEPDHDTDAMDEEPENDTGDNIPVMIPIGADVTQTGSPQSGQQIGNRKRVMSQDEEKQRRASIKAILADDSITPAERRRSIQSLMDGRRGSVGTATSISTSTVLSNNDDMYEYGDTSLDKHENVAGNILLDDLTDDKAICIPISNENTKRAETTRPPCNHYDRNCTLIAPCCGAAFGCRICHDDSPILPPTLIVRKALRRATRSSSMPGGWTSMEESNTTPQDTHHTIDRFKVSEIICRVCFTKQSSKTYVFHRRN